MYTLARQRLTGWGGTTPSVAEVVDLPAADLPDVLAGAGPRGVLMRGLGRSYGDAALNSGGRLARLSSTAFDSVLDSAAGTVTVPAGASLDDLLRLLIPRGFFVPVTPGTRFVSVGGAIASDIHGKNHHLEGSFGHHIVCMTMILADGSTVTASPSDHPDLFWATIGGMGLTGAIIEATLRLLPIETSRMSVDTTRFDEFDDLLAAMTEGDDRYRYSVAWLDLAARGGHLGRSVLTRGDHAQLSQLDNVAARDPLAYAARQIATVPPLVPPSGLINNATVAVFNDLWFRTAPRHRMQELQTIASFFHPLDLLGSWNRVYGRRGLVQYQFVVPFGEEATLRRVIALFAAYDASSFLTVLKRFGPGNAGMLSFPTPGWTLAVDVPAATRGLDDLLPQLDRLVLDAGGRHYLAKDSHTTPDVIRRGYPRLGEWQAVRRAVDPEGVWQSDLARRLELCH